MARDPGYFVQFTDKEGNKQKGRTFHREQPINGKVVVYYLDNDFKQVKEKDKDGKEVWKKRLIAHDRLIIRGMCD